MAEKTLEERLSEMEESLAIVQRVSIYGFITLLRLKVSGISFDENAAMALDAMEMAVIEVLKLQGVELPRD